MSYLVSSKEEKLKAKFHQLIHLLHEKLFPQIYNIKFVFKKINFVNIKRSYTLCLWRRCECTGWFLSIILARVFPPVSQCLPSSPRHLLIMSHVCSGHSGSGNMTKILLWLRLRLTTASEPEDARTMEPWHTQTAGVRTVCKQAAGKYVCV